MTQHLNKIYIAIGLALCSSMIGNISVANTTQKRTHTAPSRWTNAKTTFVPPPAIDERLSSFAPPPAIDERLSSFAPPPVIDETISSFAQPPSVDEQLSSFASPPAIMIGEQLSSFAPPTAIMIDEQLSSFAPPPAIMIDEPLSSGSPIPARDEALSPSHIDANPKYDINNLKQLCPLADICTPNKRDNKKLKKGSCCLPCKCDSSCQKMGNCCEKSDTHEDMCHIPYVEQDGAKVNGVLEYFMVDTCLNDSSFQHCLAEEVAPWGTLYPVYDPASDLNYYNHRCAECNGVENYKFWDLNLESFSYEWSLSNCLNALSRGKLKDCKIGFTPPKEMNILDHVCSHDLVSSCNVTGYWAQYDAELEHACHMWFSPVLDEIGQLEYTNIYCAICNGVNYAPTDVCYGMATNISDGSPPVPLGSQNALSMILDYEKVTSVINNPSVASAGSTKNGNCGRLMVKHPTKDECRTVLCPNGFFRDGGVCVPISTKWRTSMYFIQLIMTPVESTGFNMLPLFYLITDEALQPPDLWFDCHVAPLDYFKMYGKIVDYGNDSYIEELLVRIGRRKSPLNIAAEIKTIRDAMHRNWNITLKGRTFSFTVRFDRYAQFVPDGLSRRYEVVRSSPENFIWENLYPPKIYDLFLLKGDYPDVVLKKTHFCERVRLSRSEWVGGFQEIRLYLGSEVPDVLGDSEFDIYTDDEGRPTIEICVEDFNPNYQARGGVESGTFSTTLYGSYVIVVIGIVVITATV